jgi:hypothetical protein
MTIRQVSAGTDSPTTGRNRQPQGPRFTSIDASEGKGGFPEGKQEQEDVEHSADSKPGNRPGLQISMVRHTSHRIYLISNILPVVLATPELSVRNL